jgi:hypothetical protein
VSNIFADKNWNSTHHIEIFKDFIFKIKKLKIKIKCIINCL